VIYRPYDHDRDKDACVRIFQEVGWVSPGMESVPEWFLPETRARVAEVHGEAECLVTSTPGNIRYLEEELPFACITSVATSRVVRKQGCAQRVTAGVLAEDAQEGALVAGLGMFEQGFYNQLGFGTGSYDHSVSFDPASLTVDVKPRPPTRFAHADWERLHAARLARRPGHGACNITPAVMTRFDLGPPKEQFGLGYCDGPAGELTHYFWCHPSGEHGPYRVKWLVFRTAEQFTELLALLKSFGDQVRLVGLREPHGVQLQDLVKQPFRDRVARSGGKFEAKVEAGAYYQFRMLDIPGCLAQTRLPGADVLRLNVHLTDPIEDRLPAGTAWRGIAGDYLVALGPESSAEPGSDGSLPTLTATVNAFTRLWLGVRPATGLSLTDDLAGPPELLEALDQTLRLPVPHPDWDF